MIKHAVFVAALLAVGAVEGGFSKEYNDARLIDVYSYIYGYCKVDHPKGQSWDEFAEKHKKILEKDKKYATWLGDNNLRELKRRTGVAMKAINFVDTHYKEACAEVVETVGPTFAAEIGLKPD